MNRLPIAYKFPPNYKESDFADILTQLINNTKLGVENGNIKMGAFQKEKEFERFGKKFKVTLLAIVGQIYINIEEINVSSI